MPLKFLEALMVRCWQILSLTEIEVHRQSERGLTALHGGAVLRHGGAGHGGAGLARRHRNKGI